MSNSSSVTYTRISPNRNSPRNHKIDKITIHHVAGNLSLQALGNIFANRANEKSANYGIDSEGRVGLYVEEKDRSWCSSNRENDHRAVTIEVANDGRGPDWHVSDKALAATIELCADICKRNDIKELNFTGDRYGNLTMHKYFAATACPGPYLGGKFPYIAQEVNKRLKASEKPTAAKKKSIDAIAKEVIAGKWGNGDERKKRLKAAGYDPAKVQAKVNALINAEKAPAKKSNQTIAKEVIAGKWGNGDERKKKLRAAGYNPSTIQALVNKMI